MVDVQNEIKYAISWQILNLLLKDGRITDGEYDAAHRMVIGKYRPRSVRQK